jgi:hypothetical protein
MSTMTQEEIDHQREFLGDGHRYDRKRRMIPVTSKPCDGCGRFKNDGVPGHEHYYNRPSDRVCKSCQELLYEALNGRESLLSETEHKLYFVETAGFYEGRHTSGTFLERSGHDNLLATLDEKDDFGRQVDRGYILEAAIFQLTRLLSANLPTKDQDSAEVETLYPRKPGSYSTPSGDRMWLRPEHAALLRVINRAFREMLVDRTEMGEKHGRNLLAQLAAGELSIQKFNDLTIGKDKE